MARSGRWVGGACVVLLLLAGASSAAGVVVPKQGTFAGAASQDFTGSVVGFQVSGSQIKNESIVWQARCTSGKTLGSTTHVPTVLPLSAAPGIGGGGGCCSREGEHRFLGLSRVRVPSFHT